ncbi:MAG: ArsA family ATPase [Thermodesulfobacteriota bacterium]|nr:ArsA family ATPase [Thermodesulfobacteriota bacterium]
MKSLFFTGKGGVGKSTMATAAAWQLSQKSRVLIVSLDPAHNLGDIFGVDLKDKKSRYTKTLYLKEIDLQKLSREYLQREINVLSGTYKYLQTLNLDNYFSVLKYSPGIEEYALLTSIEKTIRDETDFDYIIFDTPPTGLTLRFLALPRVTITWIDRLIQIRQKILEKRYTIHRIRGTLSSEETLLDYKEEDDDILKKLWKLNTNYQALNKILQGENCSIILVFNPDILSLKESRRLMEGLNDLNLPLRLLISNKVTKENEGMAGYVEENMKKTAKDVPVDRVSLSKTLLDGKNEKLYDIQEDITANLL